jgi:predicted transcriptional regulator
VKHTDRIAQIKSRAQALNLSISALCKKAQVSKSSVWKWEKGLVDPQIGKLGTALSRLETALAAEEQRLREIVAPAKGEAA